MVELVLLDEGGVAGPGAGRSQVESMSIEKYTVEEVATHSSADDCWVIIHGKIYDVTKYLDDHPGGDQVLLMSAGEDATEEFDDAGHSTDAWKLMEKYVVGQVDETSVSTTKSSQFLYKTLPTVASVLVLGLVAGVILWRKKRIV